MLARSSDKDLGDGWIIPRSQFSEKRLHIVVEQVGARLGPVDQISVRYLVNKGPESLDPEVLCTDGYGNRSQLSRCIDALWESCAHTYMVTGPILSSQCRRSQIAG
jgi:hypothetical protein